MKAIVTNPVPGSDVFAYPSLLDMTVDELAAYLEKGTFTSVDLVTVRCELRQRPCLTCDY